MIRVLIAHDEPLARAALRTVLETAEGIQVAGACPGKQVVTDTHRHRPDVLLMGIQAEDAHTLKDLALLSSIQQAPRIAILISHQHETYVAAAVAAGATGFLLKNSEPEQFIDAVRILAKGGSVLAEPIAKKVLNGFLSATPSTDAAYLVSSLTAQQRQVLSLVAEGLSNREIAHRLRISPGTAKGYLSEILTKTGTTNRVQASVLAERAGLIKAADGG